MRSPPCPNSIVIVSSASLLLILSRSSRVSENCFYYCLFVFPQLVLTCDPSTVAIIILVLLRLVGFRACCSIRPGAWHTIKTSTTCFIRICVHATNHLNPRFLTAFSFALRT